MEQLREWIKIDNNSDTPLYLQITNAFIHSIMNGRLRQGLKLSGSRVIADMLGINRMTMVAAFDELQAQGWIEMIPRKGTFISKELPSLRPKRLAEQLQVFSVPSKPMFAVDARNMIPNPAPGLHDFSKIVFNDGFPDTRLAPTDILFRYMRSFAQVKANRKHLLYGGPEGSPALRETLADVLRDTRGIPVNTENIMVTRGAQMGLFITTSILVKPGDDVIVGTPGYGGATKTFQQLGAKINTVPVDHEGITIDAIETICRKKRISLVYVVPHHHHPTTVTLTPQRRIRLLELAARYKFAIVEDDYDYDFHYASKPMMPMASLDRQGSVIYIGTLTKTLAPAFRVGFIAAPENFIKLAANYRRYIDTQGDNLLENAIAMLYKEGIISRHIKKTVKLYKERRDHFCNLLKKNLGDLVEFNIPDGGMSVWVTFKKHDLRKLTPALAEKGLTVRSGLDFVTLPASINACRMGFASLTFEEQEKAVAIMKACMR